MFNVSEEGDEFSCPGREQRVVCWGRVKGREGKARELTAMDGRDKATSGHWSIEQKVEKKSEVQKISHHYNNKSSA